MHRKEQSAFGSHGLGNLLDIRTIYWVERESTQIRGQFG